MSAALLKRHRLMCNFLTWREYTVVYKRYGLHSLSLFLLAHNRSH
jgi:hypothetical protein